MTPELTEVRACEDWLLSYGKLTDKQESPAMFHFYCAFFALSAALGRKVWLNRGFYKLYPNLYVVLVAGSGRCRKSAAIGITERLLIEGIDEIPLIAQKITPEALLKSLSETCELTGRSEAVVIAEELGVFLGSDINNLPLIQLLTKLYNCENKMTYQTLGRGKEVCENSHCCLLGGTTPEWMRTSLPKTAIEGGFTGRFLFVYQSEPKAKIFEPYFDAELWQSLSIDLGTISQLEGEISFTEDAKTFAKNWYESGMDETELDDVKMDGYMSRKHDTVLKLSMLLSVSRDNEMKILKKDVISAIALIKEVEKRMGGAFRAFETTESGAAVRQIKRLIMKAGQEGIKHSKLMSNVSYKYNKAELDMIISTLISMEEVEQFILKGAQGRDRKAYRYIPQEGSGA